MAKRRRKSAAKRTGGGGGRSLGSMFSSLGKFARPAKGAAFGMLTGWLTKQTFFASIPAIGGSRLITAALAGAFLSDQKGMIGEIAGEVGVVAATAVGFQYGRGDVVSGAPSDELADRLAELEDRVAGELEDVAGDDDDDIGDGFVGDDDDEVGDEDEVGDVVEVEAA